MRSSVDRGATFLRLMIDRGKALDAGIYDAAESVESSTSNNSLRLRKIESIECLRMSDSEAFVLRRRKALIYSALTIHSLTHLAWCALLTDTHFCVMQNHRLSAHTTT